MPGAVVQGLVALTPRGLLSRLEYLERIDLETIDKL